MEVKHIILSLFCMLPVCLAQGNICETKPCLNGGYCATDDRVTYTCTCAPGYEGTNCEIREPDFGFQMEGATVVIGVVAGCMILFSIVLVLVICCALKRRRFHRHDKFLMYDNMSVETNHADHVNFNRAYSWQSDHKKTMNNVIVAPSPAPPSIPEGYVTKVNMNERLPRVPTPPPPQQYQPPGSISVFSTFKDGTGLEKSVRVA